MMMKNSCFAIAILVVISGCGSIKDMYNNAGQPEFNSVSVDVHEEVHGPNLKHVEEKIAKRELVAKQREISNQRYYETYGTRNSLWRPGPGARTFFRDKRVKIAGDILKVKITIDDEAKVENKSSKNRNSKANLGIPNLFGLETKVSDGSLPVKMDPSKLIGISGSGSSAGGGKIDRSESVSTTIAVTVIRVLGNGNLLIKGSQEIRINNELREITLEGIARPEDIANDNSILLEQIAEARVSYGGRGQIAAYQKDAYGTQALNAFSPF